MAKLEGVFNAADVPERDDFTPVPPGAYNVMIVSSEIKETSKGGQMLVVEMDIQDGDHSGRKLFDRLNIKNENSKTVDIAYRTLGEIVKAVGKSTIADTNELHDKRLTVNVSVEPAKPYTKDGVDHPGKPQNSVKRYLPYGGAVAATPAQATTTQAVQGISQVGASTPPWKRKQ